MKYLLPFIPVYATLVPLVVYLVKHEKKHSRITVYLVQICHKLGIPCREKDD